MEKSKMTMQLIACFAATSSMLCVGFNQGWSAPSLPKLLAPDSDIPITPDQSSWITSAGSVGNIFGSFIGVALFEKFSRKLCHLFAIIPLTISCILIGVAQSYWWFIAARLLGGVGIGSLYIVIPAYVGEIADDRIRGALGAMITVWMDTGILITYCVGPWVSRAVLAILGGACPLVFGLIFIWMPESPYYLVMKDKSEYAEKSLIWLRGTRYVSEELKKVQGSVEFDRQHAGNMKDLVLVAGNRKALFIIIGLLLAQQLTGIGAILAYSSLIFEASGSTLDSNILVIIIGVIQLLSVALTTSIVDLAGRRTLLLLSAVGSILFLAGEALYFQLQAMGSDVDAISWLPVTAIIGYIICYSIGYGTLPCVVLSEIFPCNVKGLAAMAATIAGSIGGIIVMKLYQVIADEYGIHVPFWGFVVLTVFSGIFIYFFVPETKQRSFKSIQDELHRTTESTIELSKSQMA